MGHWGEKRPPPFSHPWQERGTHTTGDSLALAFVGRDHKPAHLATGCIFPWTDDVDVCSQGLRRLAATRRRTLSTSLLLLCPSRRRGTQRFCRHCRPASSFLSSFLSPPPFLLFFPSRGRPSDGRAITLGSRIFSAEQSLSRFSPHGERVWTGKSTVCGGLSRTPHPGSSLSNQSRKTVGKCRTSLPNYARSRVSLAEDSLQELAGNVAVVERGFCFFFVFFRQSFSEGTASVLWREEGQLPVFSCTKLSILSGLFWHCLCLYTKACDISFPFFSSLSPRH